MVERVVLDRGRARAQRLEVGHRGDRRVALLAQLEDGRVVAGDRGRHRAVWAGARVESERRAAHAALRPCSLASQRAYATGQEAIHPAHDVARAQRVEHLEGVLGVRQLGVADGGLRDRAQQRDEVTRVAHRHQRVERTVDHEEGRRVAAHAAHRRRALEGVAILRELLLEHDALDEAHEAAPRIEALAIGEVVDAVERDGGLHAGVDVLEAGLVLGVVGREPDERGEMASGRAAGHGEEARVAAVLGDVLADPADRELHVDDVVREGRARREPVVRRDADPAARREMIAAAAAPAGACGRSSSRRRGSAAARARRWCRRAGG